MLQCFKSYLDLAGDPGKDGELGKMKNTSNKPTKCRYSMFWFKSPHNYCSLNLNSTFQNNFTTKMYF